VTDYTERGAIPVEDTAVDDPPTVDEVLEKQRRRPDLPDPSDDPSHQQVVEDRDEADDDAPRSASGRVTDLAIANDDRLEEEG